MTMTIEEISARLEIRQCLARYCRGVDRRDSAMLKSVYHADGTDDHSIFVGRGHDFADFLIDLLNKEKNPSTHQVTISMICVHGPDHADVESYYIAHQAMSDAQTGAPLLLNTGGRYLDKFERRNGAWKIAKRICTIDWSRRHLPGEPWEGAAQFPKVGGFGEDPSYHGFNFTL
jgi:SnoaL-like domain